jgi:hypothetical protein
MPASGRLVGVNNGLPVGNCHRALGQHGAWRSTARYIQRFRQDAHIRSTRCEAHHKYQLGLTAVQLNEVFLAQPQLLGKDWQVGAEGAAVANRNIHQCAGGDLIAHGIQVDQCVMDIVAQTGELVRAAIGIEVDGHRREAGDQITDAGRCLLTQQTRSPGTAQARVQR